MFWETKAMFEYIGYVLLGMCGVGLIGLLIWAVIEEEKQWQQYKKDHNCVRIHSKPGYSYVDYVDNKGNAHTRYVSAEETFRCDNDEIIIRGGT